MLKSQIDKPEFKFKVPTGVQIQIEREEFKHSTTIKLKGGLKGELKRELLRGIKRGLKIGLKRSCKRGLKKESSTKSSREAGQRSHAL